MNVNSAAIYFSANQLPRIGEPVTRGIPFPRGVLRQPAFLICKNPAGAPVPLQVRGLEQWGDGSWKWVLCDWCVDVETEATYHIEASDSPCPTTSLSDVTKPAVSPTKIEGLSFHLADSNGAPLSPEGTGDFVLEENGPMRTASKQIGYFVRDGRRVARLVTRISRFGARSLFRVQVTLQNFRKAEHPGGLWDLGDGGSLLFKSFCAKLPLPADTHRGGSFSPETRTNATAMQFPFELYQDSSGGENWRSTNHISRSREIPLAFQGYRLRNGSVESQGKRATPVLEVVSDGVRIGVGVPEFWQNFPKAIEVTERELTIGLFPEQTLEAHELQGGEQKTHVFYLSLDDGPTGLESLRWMRDPLTGVIDAAWMERAGAIGYLTAHDATQSGYQTLVDSAIEGSDTFEQKREIIDEYGWRHFGDIYGDHEAILHTECGPNPRISHYNNQYDPIAGFAYQWLRRGDSRWFAMMNSLAFHVRDIDLYNTDEDKAAYNHGLFWHTYHYVDADTGTHRSYPKNGRVPPGNKPVPGGGPGSEQNYAHGLLLHYYLTGDHASRESCVGMARWVIDMDDGNKTVFRFLSQGPTGVASASRSPDYHGPGRGSGNSVATLLDGFRLTGDRVFLDKAEQLIQRVIHPQDDIRSMVGMTRDGKQYVDAENRWFYVMFLQSLGKYLDLKSDLDERDLAHAHARASLLHYARWMLENEYPYLSRPEILEYPTETWVAQDMRKCEVFQFAALHADPNERPAFVEKAAEYHRHVLETLPGMPTKTLCRPVVLLLSYGWSYFWHRKHPEAVRPESGVAVGKFPAKAVFVPQKTIALRRAKKLIAATGVLFTLGVVALAIALLR